MKKTNHIFRHSNILRRQNLNSRRILKKKKIQKPTLTSQFKNTRSSAIFFPRLNRTMAVAIFVAILFAFAWSGRVATVSAYKHREHLEPAIVSESARTTRGRSARDMQYARSNTQGLDVTPDLKTTGQKFSSDEYHTLSSLTPDNAVSDDSPVTPKVDAYPPLTVADSSPLVPPPQSFITRSRYVGSNPYLYGGVGGGRAYRPDVDVDSGDQLSEYSTSNVNAVPKWNRLEHNML